MEFPQGFQEKYQRLLGSKESAAFFTALQQPFQKGFRVNPHKVTNRETLETFLSLEKKAPYSPVGYYGEVSGKTPIHQGGWVYSQEISAMVVAETLPVNPGDKVLDLCAAPGGKTTRLGDKLSGKGLLVANEIFPKRSKVLSENIERWGISNALVTNHAPKDLTPHFLEFFDKVLVDAPCSGEGMFQKEPDALSQWSPEYVLVCQKRQKEILKEAVMMLKPQGELVYSTCTFSPEENEEIIDYLVLELGMKVLDIPNEKVAALDPGRSAWSQLPEIEKTRRIWPHKNQGAGHFVAYLKKDTVEKVTQLPKKTKKKQSKNKNLWTKEEELSWQSFLAEFPLNLPQERLLKTKDTLWLLPEFSIDFAGLKLIRNGLQLGTFMKKRFVPSYSLALSLKDYQPYPHVKITLANWKQYVAGMTFPVVGKNGLVLVVYEDIIVGFGKITQGTLKNYFPKGLRMNVN